MESEIRIVQVTDLHLAKDAEFEIYGVRTAEKAERVFEAIRGMVPGPDLIVATGDLTHDGEIETYRRLRALADTFPCPVKCTPGNHDVRRSFRTGWEGHSLPDGSPLDHAFDHQGLQVILLDSTVPGEEGGHFQPEQIRWLQEEVAGDPRPKLVFLHHQPMEVGSAWLDRMMVSNPEELFAALGPVRERLLGIIFGHIHQDFQGEWQGIPVIGTRATSVQFTPRTEEFQTSDEPPGYRVIEIRDGRLLTRSVPVAV